MTRDAAKPSNHIMTNTEIIKGEVSSIALSPKGEVVLTNVREAFGFAALMGQASMLPKGASVEGAVVSIIAGAAVGLNPFQAVQGIAVINGRPAIWGDAMTAIVKASGLLEDERIEYLPSYRDCKGVRVTCKRKGVATPYVGLFSLEDAKTAGLLGKSGPWTQYPVRMLLNRARAFAYRDGFSDVLRGMRSAEEEQDTVVSQGGGAVGNMVATAEAANHAEEAKHTLRRKGAVASEIIDAVEVDDAAAAPGAAPEQSNGDGGNAAGTCDEVSAIPSMG